MSDSSVEKQLSVTWDQPTCGSRNGGMSKYEYYFGLDIENGEPVYGSTQPDSRMVTFTELEHYTEYEFQVRASTSKGVGPYSGIVKVTTAESSKLF